MWPCSSEVNRPRGVTWGPFLLLLLLPRVSDGRGMGEGWDVFTALLSVHKHSTSMRKYAALAVALRPARPVPPSLSPRGTLVSPLPKGAAAWVPYASPLEGPVEASLFGLVWDFVVLGIEPGPSHPRLPPQHTCWLLKARDGVSQREQ